MHAISREMSQESEAASLSSSSYGYLSRDEDELLQLQESDDDNNNLPLGSSPPPGQNGYIEDDLLANDIFGNEFNFAFDNAWDLDEEFGFNSPLRGPPSPAFFLPQPHASPQRPPPSNQQARTLPRPARLHEPPQINNTALQFGSDPFDEYLDFTPPPPSPQPSRAAPSRPTTRHSSVVDLTESPPLAMAPGLRSREKRRSRDSDDASEERPSKLRKTAKTKTKTKVEDADVIDLVDMEDGMQYKEFQAKQQAEAIKQQNLRDATRPVKLVEFQCIICMDSPTDLTVTHCGKYRLSGCLTISNMPQDTSSAPNACTKLYMLETARRHARFVELLLWYRKKVGSGRKMACSYWR